MLVVAIVAVIMVVVDVRVVAVVVVVHMEMVDVAWLLVGSERIVDSIGRQNEMTIIIIVMITVIVIATFGVEVLLGNLYLECCWLLRVHNAVEEHVASHFRIHTSLKFDKSDELLAVLAFQRGGFVTLGKDEHVLQFSFHKVVREAHNEQGRDFFFLRRSEGEREWRNGTSLLRIDG